jgi:hypothetical protein
LPTWAGAESARTAPANPPELFAAELAGPELVGIFKLEELNSALLLFQDVLFEQVGIFINYCGLMPPQLGSGEIKVC